MTDKTPIEIAAKELLVITQSFSVGKTSEVLAEQLSENAIRALEDAGYRIMPKECDEAVIAAGFEEFRARGQWDEGWITVWAAMHTAAPRWTKP